MSTAKEKFELARQRYAATFERHLDNGVEFISDNVYIEPEVIITPGTVILPGCILRGKTVIAENCVIGPNTLLEDTIVEAGTTINASQCYESHIGPNNKIGPFTHVRTGTKTAEGCHLGAYVETKNADFAEGNTVSHLTYIGDATVGKYCNFGCGTVLQLRRRGQVPHHHRRLCLHRLQHQPGGPRHCGRPCLHRRRFHHRPRCARRCPEHRARQADRDRQLGREQAAKVHRKKTEIGSRQKEQVKELKC